MVQPKPQRKAKLSESKYPQPAAGGSGSSGGGSSFDHVLKLVRQLSPEEQERLAEEIKLQWLRREIQKGADQLDRGQGIPGEQVIAELRERNKAFREKGTV